MREVNVLFAVDLFNEGVDVPEIDTVLFLRPTESATVFLQQLGRGLRQSRRTRTCLTVLDFIGNAQPQLPVRSALPGAHWDHSRRRHRADRGGLPVPARGCTIQLDRVATKLVLENLKRSIGAHFATFVRELKRHRARRSAWRSSCGRRASALDELYRNAGWTWTQSSARGRPADACPRARARSSCLGRSRRCSTRTIRVRLAGSTGDCSASRHPPTTGSLTEAQRRVLLGLALHAVGQSRRMALEHRRLDGGALARIPRSSLSCVSCCRLLEDEARAPDASARRRCTWTDVPLSVHASYALDEILAAFGEMTLARAASHPRRDANAKPSTNSDLFFVTLEKTEERLLAARRMYKDYAISPELFHWESQSFTTQRSPHRPALHPPS